MQCRLHGIVTVLIFAACTASTPCQSSRSFYPERLSDKAAVYLDDARFGVKGDGTADDTDALQKAINTVADEHHEGILFVPSGRYRITHTIFVWPSIRLIGFGAQRPVILLPPNTPGYSGEGPAYMMVFAGGRISSQPEGAPPTPQRPGGMRRVPQPLVGTVPLTPTIDANPGTFYSAMSNIDLEIGDGNTGAVGIRFHVAQHCFLSHMDFHIGSGLAALQDIGNEGEDLRFFEGRYGILTGRPSPGWQYTLLDSTFDGQREAAIREHEAGLVLVHDTFRNTPTAIDIEPQSIEELWVQHVRFENIIHVTGQVRSSRAAILWVPPIQHGVVKAEANIAPGAGCGDLLNVVTTERRVHDIVVRSPGVEHAKAVVMFGHKYRVADAALVKELYPIVGIEMLAPELLVKLVVFRGAIIVPAPGNLLANYA